MLSKHQKQFFLFFLAVLAAFLLIRPDFSLQAALPPALAATQIDWVCVTDVELVEAYAPLAAHRETQGLTTIVLSLDEVMLWSPAGNDTTASLRWLAGVAHEQWDARYLLLGGSHALLPAPVHVVTVGDVDSGYPTDAYYSCLDGDWDQDGDGIVAEWEEDAADPTVHLKLGRLPADTAQEVRAAVAKIVAFERRTQTPMRGGLFVSSLLAPWYDPEQPYPNWALAGAENLRDVAVALDPTLRAGTLFQGPPGEVPPADDPLNEAALVDSLGARPHDLVHIQLNGASHAWELVSPLRIVPASFTPLAEVDHSFLLTMISGPVGDTRGINLLAGLLTQPGGGPTGAVAPTGLGYYFPMSEFEEMLWARLLDGDAARLGDAFAAALDDFVTAGLFSNTAAATTWWYQALLGDPATLLRPLEPPATVPGFAAGPANLHAAPNPFNPVTTIGFDIAGNAERPLVKVEIFDIGGHHVATLLEKSLPPGPHAVPWNATAPSGLYFARVSVAGVEKTIKLSLVK